MLEYALGVGAAGWGMIMAVSPVLQIRRMLQRRSSHDVSIGYFAVLLPGFALWTAYGLAISNLVLVVPNVGALLVGLTTVAIAVWFRRDARRRASGAERPPTRLDGSRQPDGVSSPAATGAASTLPGGGSGQAHASSYAQDGL